MNKVLYNPNEEQKEHLMEQLAIAADYSPVVARFLQSNVSMKSKLAYALLIVGRSFTKNDDTEADYQWSSATTVFNNLRRIHKLPVDTMTVGKSVVYCLSIKSLTELVGTKKEQSQQQANIHKLLYIHRKDSMLRHVASYASKHSPEQTLELVTEALYPSE